MSEFVVYIFLCQYNGCRINVDIMTGEKLSSLGDMEFVYWSVRSFSRRGGDVVKGEKGCFVRGICP